MTTIRYTYANSPLGPLLLMASEQGICGIHMAGDRHGPAGPAEDWREDAQAFDLLRCQLDEYFAGRRRNFDLKLDMAGTGFQRAVWQALCAIPYGSTISYGELARRIANPRAVRAVALANGRNPVSIIVPCHRVIGADGSLTGYSGGLDKKRFLLELEDANRE